MPCYVAKVMAEYYIIVFKIGLNILVRNAYIFKEPVLFTWYFVFKLAGYSPLFYRYQNLERKSKRFVV